MNSRRRATRFRGQCHELFALAEEEHVAPDEERAASSPPQSDDLEITAKTCLRP
jgi:hypothetical protein